MSAASEVKNKLYTSPGSTGRLSVILAARWGVLKTGKRRKSRWSFNQIRRAAPKSFPGTGGQEGHSASHGLPVSCRYVSNWTNQEIYRTVPKVPEILIYMPEVDCMVQYSTYVVLQVHYCMYYISFFFSRMTALCRLPQIELPNILACAEPRCDCPTSNLGRGDKQSDSLGGATNSERTGVFLPGLFFHRSITYVSKSSALPGECRHSSLVSASTAKVTVGLKERHGPQAQLRTVDINQASQRRHLISNLQLRVIGRISLSLIMHSLLSSTPKSRQLDLRLL